MALDLSSLLISVADNLDGLTAAVSVTGAGAGGSVAVLRAAWNHQAGGAMVWSEVATGTADGSGDYTVNVNTTPGFYIWQAVRMATSTTADRLTRAVFRPVIDPTEAIHSRVLDAVVSLIRSLNLSGIGSTAAKVFKRWAPIYMFGADDVAAGGGGLPMVQVAPYGKELSLDILTTHDDVGYPVIVGFFDKSNETVDYQIPRNLKWRRQVGAAFRAQRLAGVPEITIGLWQPDVVIDVAALQQNYTIGAMALSFRSRETRGLIA